MMKRNLSLLVSIFILLSSIQILGQDKFKKVAQSGMQFLKIGVGAEMVGRGEAGISAVKGVNAMFWNPAGLAELENNEVLFSHNSWIADISMNAIGVGINVNGLGVFGASILWMDYGELYKTSVARTLGESAQDGYVEEGTFKPSDMAFGISYAKRVSTQFSFGGQVRYLYENYGSNITVNTSGEESVTNNTMSAFCFDFGTLYYPGYKSLAFSMAIQNFSTDLRYQQESFSTPLTFKVGLSINMLDFWENKSQSSLLLAVDAIHPKDYTERVNIGVEYSYLGLFNIRGGYRMNYDIGEFTVGAGVKYSISNDLGMKLDVSYMIENSGRFTAPLQLTAGFLMF